jgi:hypothetical protein
MTFSISEFMESAVCVLERAGREANESLDDVERKILSANPSAKQLLDLCARLRSAKGRLASIQANMTHLFTAQDQLKQNLAQYLVPTAESIKNACIIRNLPTPRVVFSSPGDTRGSPEIPLAAVAATQPLSIVTAKPATPAAPKQNRHISPRVAKPAPPPQFGEFVEITEEEFASLDIRTMGHVTLSEVRDVYKFIWSHFKDLDDRKAILTRKLISESGAKMRALPTALRFLKSLHRIDLTKQGDVKWISQ